jgi:hypothetical protein
VCAVIMRSWYPCSVAIVLDVLDQWGLRGGDGQSRQGGGRRPGLRGRPRMASPGATGLVCRGHRVARQQAPDSVPVPLRRSEDSLSGSGRSGGKSVEGGGGSLPSRLTYSYASHSSARRG